MNNGNNPKKTGMKLLQHVQILYQNNAISVDDKNEMVTRIKEGMAEGTFYKLNLKLFAILDTTSLPQVVEDMISITF